MPLANVFINRYNKTHCQNKLLTYDVIKALEEHEWIGNVRELKNVIENMVIVSNNEYLQTEDLPWVERSENGEIEKEIREISRDESLTLGEAKERLERLILAAEVAKGSTTREIAEKHKVNSSTIVRKLQKYELNKR